MGQRVHIMLESGWLDDNGQWYSLQSLSKGLYSTHSLITQETAIWFVQMGHSWRTIPSTSHSHVEDQVVKLSLYTVHTYTHSNSSPQCMQTSGTIFSSYRTQAMNISTLLFVYDRYSQHVFVQTSPLPWPLILARRLSSGITSSLLWYTSVVSKGCILKTESIMHTHTQTKHWATIIISMSLCTVRPTTLCSITTLQCH